MFKSIFAFLFLAVLTFFVIGCSSMGSTPSQKQTQAYADSKNFNSEQQTFVNRKPKIIDEMTEKNFSFKDIIAFFKERVDAQPAKPLPQIRPDLEEFLKPSKDLKSIWFGHSTFLLNMDGKIVLVDPVFSKSAAPVSFMIKRFQAPVLKLEELPHIDYVLISHDHYDHLDMESVKFFRDKDVKFVTPLGVGAHLEGWGVSSDKIIEKDWWEKAEFAGIRFIATPAQHFSGRGFFDRNKTLWASWVLQTENHNIYFSGDSGYDIHFKEIGEKYGPFDVAYIESGQYNEKWKEVHMLPKDAIQAYKDLRAKAYFPVHWGMFVLSMHTWYDPVVQLFELSKGEDINLVVPKIGQIVNFSEGHLNEFWWQDLVTASNLGEAKLVCQSSR